MLQPLFYIEAVYRHREGRDIQILTDAHLKNPFRSFFDDFERNIYATAIAESCRQLFHDGVPLHEEFGEIISFLEAIESGECEPAAAFFSFLHTVLRYSGFALSIDGCFACGKTEPAGDVRIDLENGTFLCAECLAAGGIKANMGKERFLMLREIGQKKRGKQKIGREDEQKLLNFYLAYIRHHWKSDLKIKAFELIG
jgi:DNA repair protein RecO